MTEGFRPNAQGSNMANWHQGWKYCNENWEGKLSEMGTVIATKTTTRTTIETEMIRLNLMFLLKIGNLVLGKMKLKCHVLRIWCKRLLGGLIQLMIMWRWWYTHAVSIKHFEQQMTDLSTTVNPCQPSTLPSNTIKNPKNDGHVMSVTTWKGKQSLDPPMSGGWKVRLVKKMMWLR